MTYGIEFSAKALTWSDTCVNIAKDAAASWLFKVIALHNSQANPREEALTSYLAQIVSYLEVYNEQIPACGATKQDIVVLEAKKLVADILLVLCSNPMSACCLLGFLTNSLGSRLVSGSVDPGLADQKVKLTYFEISEEQKKNITDSIKSALLEKKVISVEGEEDTHTTVEKIISDLVDSCIKEQVNKCSYSLESPNMIKMRVLDFFNREAQQAGTQLNVYFKTFGNELDTIENNFKKYYKDKTINLISSDVSDGQLKATHELDFDPNILQNILDKVSAVLRFSRWNVLFDALLPKGLSMMMGRVVDVARTLNSLDVVIRKWITNTWVGMTLARCIFDEKPAFVTNLPSVAQMLGLDRLPDSESTQVAFSSTPLLSVIFYGRASLIRILVAFYIVKTLLRQCEKPVVKYVAMFVMGQFLRPFLRDAVPSLIKVYDRLIGNNALAQVESKLFLEVIQFLYYMLEVFRIKAKTVSTST